MTNTSDTRTCSTCHQPMVRGYVIGTVATCHGCAELAVRPPRLTALEKRAARDWRSVRRCRLSA